MIPKELTDTGNIVFFMFDQPIVQNQITTHNKILLTILIVTITFSSNVISALAALFFTNHSVQL